LFSQDLDRKKPFSGQLPEKSPFFCNLIFPNDEIKFVAKRKQKLRNKRKNGNNSGKNKDEIKDSHVKSKVKIRSCDPCRVF